MESEPGVFPTIQVFVSPESVLHIPITHPDIYMTDVYCLSGFKCNLQPSFDVANFS